jgi:hypothetical protein
VSPCISFLDEYGSINKRTISMDYKNVKNQTVFVGFYNQSSLVSKTRRLQ